MLYKINESLLTFLRIQKMRNSTRVKIKAVLEVVSLFIFLFLLIGVLSSSPLGKWERHLLQRTFLEYALMIFLPLLLLAAKRRNFSAYGISFKNLKYHLDVALTCFIPYAVIHAVSFAIQMNSREWSGALISASLSIGLLFVFAYLWKNKPTMGSLGIICAFLFLMPAISPTSSSTAGKAVSAFIFYLVFLGPGEEILFRGYIQSRLNKAFGRPYSFFKVNWGWGVVITSLLFGLMHFLNLTSLFMGKLDFQWWWGFDTFFWGLVFGFVREKTGSIVAPAILHGLPQAIAYAYLGL